MSDLLSLAQAHATSGEVTKDEDKPDILHLASGGANPTPKAGSTPNAALDDIAHAAGAGTIARASLAPDVKVQMQRYAEAFKQPLSDFGLVDGNIIRKVPETGQYARVQASVAGSSASHPLEAAERAMDWVAGGTGQAIPAVTSAALAALAGTLATPETLGAGTLPAAMAGGTAGAALGETARQKLDALLAPKGEEAPMDWGNVGWQAAAGAAGPLAGKAIEAVGGRLAPILAKSAPNDLASFAPEAAAEAAASEGTSATGAATSFGLSPRVEAALKEHIAGKDAELAALRKDAQDLGIDLSLGQLTGSEAVKQSERQLIRQPETVQAVADLRTAQNEQQIPAAVRSVMDEIAPDAPAGQQVESFRQGAQDVVKKGLDDRSAAAEIAYGEANKGGSIAPLEDQFRQATIQATAQKGQIAKQMADLKRNNPNAFVGHDLAPKKETQWLTVTGPGDEPTEVAVNPSMKDALALTKSGSGEGVRTMEVGGNVYAWDAYHMDHSSILDALQMEGYLPHDAEDHITGQGIFDLDKGKLVRNDYVGEEGYDPREAAEWFPPKAPTGPINPAVRAKYDDILARHTVLGQQASEIEEARQAMLDRFKQAQADKTANAPGAVWSPRLQQFLDDPDIKPGIARGLRIQRLEALAKGQKFDPTEYAITGADENGEPVVGSVPNMRLLHAAKKGIDAIIADNTDEFGKVNDLGRAAKLVQDSYLNEVDNLNPAYGAARKKFAMDSQAIDAIKEGGVGFLNKITGLDRQQIVNRVFSGDNALPEDIAMMRRQFAYAGKSTEWNNGVRSYIADKLADAVAPLKTGGAPSNVGGGVYKNLFEDRQSKMIQAAMGGEENPSFINSWNKLGRVLKAASNQLPEGSPTATDTAAPGLVKRGVQAVKYMLHPAAMGADLMDGLSKMKDPEEARKLAETLLTPEGDKLLKSLAPVTPGTPMANNILLKILTQAGVITAGEKAREDDQ